MTPVRACLNCLGTEPPDVPGAPYHATCLVQFFGVPSLPRVDVDLMNFPARAEQSVGKMSISGAQRKHSYVSRQT